MPVPASKNGAFWYIVLRLMLLIYIRVLIQFSNCDGLSRMNSYYNEDVIKGVQALYKI